MRKDIYGQLIFSEQDICSVYLTNPEIKKSTFIVEPDTKIDFSNLDLENTPSFVEYKELDVTISFFDEVLQSVWFMPESYKNMDIAKWVLEQCNNNDVELQRAGQELLLYQERNMFMLLRYLKYLIDTFRKHNIVWGVGRGSCVSSFVLYLIGVHKINSIYYDLDIKEFLK